MRTIALLACLLLAGPALAAKTDALVLANGDRVTCEIKKLERGMLTVKTDDMGTLQVKWDRIARLASGTPFLVRTGSGLLHFGTLGDPGRDRALLVMWLDRIVELPMELVTAIEPIKATFWDRVTLALSLGASYTKATSVSQLYFDGNADYRGRVHGLGARFATNITDKGDDSPLYRRWDGSLVFTRRISGRLRSEYGAGAQRNDELGLRLRVQGGVGAGYRIVESSSSELAAMAGVILNREWTDTEEPGSNNVEGRLGASFAVFAYDTPKTDVRVGFDAYPSFTVRDRWRTQLDVSARREVAADLFVEIKYYASTDSRPPGEDAAKVDRGLVLSVGWTK